MPVKVSIYFLSLRSVLENAFLQTPRQPLSSDSAVICECVGEGIYGYERIYPSIA